MTDETPNEILTPGAHLYAPELPPALGSRVVVHAQGRFRVAVLIKVGPKRSTVAYATSGTPYRTPTVPHGRVFVEEGDGPPYVVRQSRTYGGRLGGQYAESPDGGEVIGWAP
jgi:hypothetical protein